MIHYIQLPKKFNTNVEEIKKINNLYNNDIYKGQVLILKDNNEIDEINTEIYTVKKGDTLYSIAKDKNISLDELKELNNLKSNDLYIGDQIIVPSIESYNDEYEIYIVKKGDSLWKIAKDNNININDLIKVNGLDNLTLNVNQELIIPENENNKDYYIVQSGDTLWSIAKKLNIDVNELKSINNINNNFLSVGQKLVIK